MYTLPSRYSNRLSVFFQENGIESWKTFDSQETENSLKPEVLWKIKDFAERTLAVFETQPENVRNFLANLNDMKETVFSNPEIFRLFLNKAYDKHAEDIASLQWSERTKKIMDFSDFVTDILLRVADTQQIPRLSLAIRTQRLTLQSSIDRTQLTASMRRSNLRDELK